MSAQTRLDLALELVQMTSDDDAYTTGEALVAESRVVDGIQIACPRHHTNHVLTLREVEELLYGIVGARADAECDDRSDVEGRDVDTEINHWCPVVDLRDLNDGEMYYEHIESWVEMRARHTRADEVKDA